ncbi:HD domain-containing protein [Kribbella solani]|uniref:HD domain-containing protein n=1 Tax=Kribbella solani TaxID=236067 RepID=UPI0029A6066C|nr:HD domain-containing protein [Kribbella solani]MDX2972293.1 HD domain-containing protein [Kribbella solani]MDX3001764.1 HD domain-containing protein [Kribbella solani]
MVEIGSSAWVARTGGALGPVDQVRFIVQAIVHELKSLRSGAGSRSWRGRSPDLTLAPDRLPPDTPIARHVSAYAQALLPEPLLRHSLRSWIWAGMLGDLDHLAYDNERLYVAALLHDVALVNHPGPDASCFAVHGAAVARQIVRDAGASGPFADTVADAIAAHFNVTVPVSWGAEAHLLHAGTHLDVAGTRRSELATSTLTEVHARAPRTGFATHFLAAMQQEATSRTNSRAAVLWRLGMGRAIRRHDQRC